MSIRLLYNHLIKKTNYTYCNKYFIPNEKPKNNIYKQLTFNKNKSYTIIQYDLSEYYINTVNNFNIYKIILNINHPSSFNNYSEEIHYSSNMNKLTLLDNNILLNNKTIKYNDVDNMFIHIIDYIGSINKMYDDIIYNKMMKDLNLLNDNIIILKNIEYEACFYKICNELTKNHNSIEVLDLVNDLINYFILPKKTNNELLINKVIEIMKNSNNILTKKELDILIKILQFI